MRYFIGFMVTVLLIIILIFMLFRGGHKTAVVPSTAKTLNSYASSDAEVTMTINGPINANQDHQATVVKVSKQQVTFQLVSGYDGHVVTQQTFANTQNAYSAFLHALTHAGFTKGDPSKLIADDTGYCPEGNRYIFGMYQNGQQLQRYWSSTCGGVATYLGNLQLTINLFRAQVPDYGTLVDNFPS